MKSWKQRILLTLVLAVAIHSIVVWSIPHIIAGIIETGMLNKEGCEQNAICHQELDVAGTDQIPMSNPDSLFSFLTYDVSRKPLDINLTVPDSDSYWSFSLYAGNLDNYYILNDRQVESNQVAIVLVGPKFHYNQVPEDKVVVVSPTDKGFGLIRMIVPDRYSVEGLEAVEGLEKIQKLAHAEQSG